MDKVYLDPIVEGVYQIRERMMEECHGDLALLITRQRSIAIPPSMQIVSIEEVCRRKANVESITPEIRPCSVDQRVNRRSRAIE